MAAQDEDLSERCHLERLQHFVTSPSVRDEPNVSSGHDPGCLG
jgi:hypothetical protein